MLYSIAFMTAKHRKVVLASLALVCMTVGLFTLSRTTGPGNDEISCTTLGGFGKPIHTLVFSPDGKTLATGDGWLDRTGEVKLWDVDAGTERVSLREHPNAIRSLAFSPDGRTLAIGYYDGTVKLWHPLKGPDSYVLRKTGAKESMVAFSPDGRTLATWAPGWQLRLRNLTTGKEQTIPFIAGPAAFCPDGHCLAAASYNTVTIWNISNGQALFSLHGHMGLVLSLAFSPDGRTLATAGYEGTVKLWDGKNGAERDTLRGHQDQVNALVFSPDGETLASGSHDCKVKIWAMATGEELASFQGHTRPVTSLAFAPSGEKIASGSYDQTVRIWHLAHRRKN
jgi:WD40 repeat protein